MARPQNKRNSRTRNTSTKSNNVFLKITASATAVILSLTAALPSIAASGEDPKMNNIVRNADGTSTYTGPDGRVVHLDQDGLVTKIENNGTTSGNTPITNAANDVEANATGGISSKTGTTAEANNAEQRELAQTTAADVQGAINECADINNPDGLGAAHKNALDRAIKMSMTTINMNNIFDIKKNQACFSALTDFPDLSVSIPSLSSIFSAMKNTLIKYANRKVCEVVNKVTSEVMGPINEVLGEFSQNGVIDLTGMVNDKIGDELYKIDPTLGTVQEGIDTGYSIDKNDVYDVIDGSTTVGDKADEILNGAIGGDNEDKGAAGDKSGTANVQPSSVERMSTLSRSNATSTQESSGIKGMISSVFGN